MLSAPTGLTQKESVIKEALIKSQTGFFEPVFFYI